MEAAKRGNAGGCVTVDRLSSSPLCLATTSQSASVRSSSLCRSEMFIDWDTVKSLRRSKGRDDIRWYRQIEFRPSNGAEVGLGIQCYRHLTPTGWQGLPTEF